MTKKDLSKAKGGHARAQALTKKERSAIARKASQARWGEKITHGGFLDLAGIKIPAYVTESGLRVLSGRGMQDALALVDESMNSSQKSGGRLGRLFSYKSLEPLINKAKESGQFEPLKLHFQGKEIHGYQADALNEICNIVLEARSQGYMKTKRQKIIAERCEVLLRAFAKVGLISLIDEATGYQFTRQREALAIILKEFIATELQKWVKTFPDEFYYQICRLKGWRLADINKRPAVFGHITNYLIYKRLAPGVLKELKIKTPRDSKGRHKEHLHRRLTRDVGHPRLRELLASEITLMRVFDAGEWDKFDEALNRAVPIYGNLPLFDQYDEPVVDSARLLH